MINTFKKWSENEFFRNVIVLFSGSAVAQAIPLLAMLVLTRLYPEEAFGVFFVYAAAGIVLAILSTLKYELSVVLPQSDTAGFSLLILSLVIALLVSIVGELMIWLFFDHFQVMLAEKSIGKWLYFLPLSMLFTGIMQAVGFWFNRFKQYKLISKSRIIKALIMSGFQIGGGIIGLHTTGLITGLIIGQGVAAIYVLILIIPEFNKHKNSLSIKGMITEGKKHLNIPVFNTLMSILNSISNQLPVFMLSRYFGIKIVAYYGMANRMISTPMGLIEQSVGSVFYQDAVKTFNENKPLYPLVIGLYKKLFKVAIIPFTLLLIFGPLAFRILLGPAWDVSGRYTQILVPWLFLAFLNIPITYIVTILGKQRSIVVYQVFLLLARFCALYFGYHFFNSAVETIVLFSSVGVLFNIFLLLYHLYLAKVQSKAIIHESSNSDWH